MAGKLYVVAPFAWLSPVEGPSTSGQGQRCGLLLPPHGHPKQQLPERQPVRLVAGEDLAEQVGASTSYMLVPLIGHG